jgi:hypothetical protein
VEQAKRKNKKFSTKKFGGDATAKPVSNGNKKKRFRKTLK